MNILFLTVRKLIYLTLLVIDQLWGAKAQIIVLCYHGLADDGWRFSVKKSNFVRQIDYLLKQNYRLITLRNLDNYLKGKSEISKPAAIITFDDGYRNLLEIKDYLSQKGIKPALFVLSDRRKADRKELATNNKLLTKKELLKLKKLGWEIGCHSATHRDFSKLEKKDIQGEVVDSKKALEKELGLRIDYFAYPKGIYNKAILRKIKSAGYQLGLSMDDALIDKTTRRLVIPRVGIEGTHSLAEFKATISPKAIFLRGLIKKLGLERYVYAH